MRDFSSSKIQNSSDSFELIELETDDVSELQHAYEVIRRLCAEMNKRAASINSKSH